ncbi:MAG: hypothetical protein K5987_09965 [Lachnospiraceae bacterium]|nr:hypothetical protein [Lachnospiraceae bacterium]
MKTREASSKIRGAFLKVTGLCIKAVIMIALLLSVMSLLFFLFLGRMMRHNDIDMEKKYKNLSPEQQEFYNFFSKKTSDGMTIKTMGVINDVMRIHFENKETIIEPVVLSEYMYNLEYYLDDLSTGLNREDRVELFFCEDYNGPWEVKAVSNFADTEYDSKLEQYAGDGTDGWWIYSMRFENWKELEDNFCSVEGICRCVIYNMDDIDEADTSKWENLRYIHLVYFGDDLELYEHRLAEMFPDAEVHINVYY